MSHFHHQHDNPFFNRQRILAPVYFWGREREVEALYGAIATRQCRSVVGERKLGKSSLLTHLACPDSLRRHGFDPERCVFIYVDLEGMAHVTYDEFWPELLDRIELALPVGQAELSGMAQALLAQGDVRFMQVRRLLRRIERAGLTVVVMLDEFESLAANADFGPGFYGELRSLAGELGVVYLTASKRGLYDLTYQHADTLSSPFFNIFSEEVLGLMPEAEAVRLLEGLSGLPHGEPFAAEEVQALIDLAGPHPFFLQVAGFYLYSFHGHGDNADDTRHTAVLPEKVVQRFRAEAEDHFRYWWRQLAERERAALLQLGTAVADPAIIRSLREKALIRRAGGGQWQPFSRAFAAFLRRTDPLEHPNQLAGSSDTSDLSGVTLGSYRVLTPIGRGGMAVVYKGYQRTLDRYVAIKVMSHAIAGSQSFVERFQREAAAVARLRHQNLVQMLDYGTHEDVSYMVMEYIDGDTLKERILQLRAREERIALPEVVEIVRDVAAALDYAHAHGIVHRDVKPTNIMLRPEERLAELTGAIPFTAVLTDFGVARMLEGVQLTDTGATIGTPDYMSPEQAQGEPASAASDIYALGIVLYEMLTGELPFTAESPVAVLLKHLQARPPLLADKVPELPAALEVVIMQALAKEPDRRFATAGQLANALTEAIEELG